MMAMSQGECSTSMNFEDHKLAESDKICVDDESDSIGIQQLPEIALLRIFSYFPVVDICTKIAPVCRHWNQLSKDPSLWTIIKFHRNVPLDTITSILSRATLLRRLSVNSVDFTVLVDSVSECRFLEKLSAKYCGIPSRGSLERLVASCSGIVQLNLKGSSAGDDDFVEVSHLPKLRKLKLAYAKHFEDLSLIAVARGCEYLEHLDLTEQQYLTDEAICTLVLHRHASLRTLILDGERLTDRAFKAIGKCSLLTRFQVKYAYKMTDIGLLALAQLVNLSVLRIERARQITDGGLAEMFSTPNMKNISVLDLSECTGLKDEALSAISNCCHKNLSWLALRWCWEVTDEGLLHIVQNCGQLKHLNLEGMRISCAVLADIPNQLPMLKFLNLEQCGATEDEDLCEINRQMSGIKIINYYGNEIEGTPEQMKWNWSRYTATKSGSSSSGNSCN